MVFTRSTDVPHMATSALQDIQNFSAGMRLPELITTISQRLTTVLTTGSKNDPFNVDDSDHDMIDQEGAEETDEDIYDEPYDYFDDGAQAQSKSFALNITNFTNPKLTRQLNKRIRSDLRAAKFAGFSIGILNGMKADSVNSLLSLSIRVSKLELSEEVMQAWDLEPQQYVVLLVRYSCGYKTFDAVISEPPNTHEVEYRVGISNRYKPTLAEGIAAFTDILKDDNNSPSEHGSGTVGKSSENTEESAGFFNLFISSSLNQFMRMEFISLLKIRKKFGVGWDGAKLFFSDKQGHLDPDDSGKGIPTIYYKESKDSTMPESIAGDHLTDSQVKSISFPLIALQFALRYLIRCTDFCLVCHDKIKENFEALKPYVCDKPLCLYQYMSLGFGPSIEHEILTQPYVVDLLVSFCYSSATVSLLVHSLTILQD